MAHLSRIERSSIEYVNEGRKQADVSRYPFLSKILRE